MGSGPSVVWRGRASLLSPQLSVRDGPLLGGRGGSSHLRIISCSHVSACSVVIRSPLAAPSARWSASSFPGTLVWERTCTSRTSPGRRRRIFLHNSRNASTIATFRFTLGIHFPVVMFMAYSESVWISSRPSPAGRRLASLRATQSAVISPVLFVCPGAPIYPGFFGSSSTFPDLTRRRHPLRVPFVLIVPSVSRVS